jgi:hypothetical protein
MKLVLAIALAASMLGAADATGTWAGSLTISGGEGRTLSAHLVLKQEGQTVTGTAGPNATEQQPIQNGKVENDQLTFELPMQESVMKFALKQSGDELTGDVTREREGQTQRATVALKRAN